jgi:hypothetical protein
MLRHILCVGDQPETGGHIEAFSPAVPSTIMGHHVAFIGGRSFCNACKSYGVIEKSGGPSRKKHCGREMALDSDLLRCQCPKPPRMVATTQSISRHDDRREALGSVVPDVSTSGPESEPFAEHPRFDEQVCVIGVDEPEGYPYLIELPDGRVIRGKLGAAQ